MKYLMILCTLVIPTIISAQYFVQPGAQWTYEIQTDWSPPAFLVPFTINYTGDTIINNINCKILAGGNLPCANGPMGDNEETYTYEENGKVFLYDYGINDFHLLADFNAQVGDQWSFSHPSFDPWVVQLDSISVMQLNGFDLKVLHLSRGASIEQLYPITPFVERIGPLGYLYFDWINPACDEVPYVRQMRCYSDDSIGLVQIFDEDYDCMDSVTIYYNSLDDCCDETVSLFPNPFHTTLNLSISENISGFLRIIDINGGLVYQDNVQADLASMNLSHLSAGVYFLEIRSGKHKPVLKKILKQ